MEKLVYVVRHPSVEPEARRKAWGGPLVDAARAAGAAEVALLVPDVTAAIRERAPARLSPDFDAVGAVLEVWLPSLDTRGPIESALAEIDPDHWGYLVTESTFGPAPKAADGQGRVPGITQITLNEKPEHVADEDFYREWQEVHSTLSFDLHPTRVSYERNAVARRLTPSSPPHRAIVLERFPRLEDFLDESIYFGDPAVVEKMIAHVPSFYRFETAITGAMSEYRLGALGESAGGGA